MQSILLIIALIILLCIVANRFSNKFGMPVLLLFMLLGIAFGVDGFLVLNLIIMSLRAGSVR